ncbi:zinc finger protein 1-like [Teleopsis dalmanni]|uniref:zinc finger protein 1-like n=1 Tax=Teleopsis dalmanni TaxID=139649 RepID=UPI0018CFB36E|nr:zinc finger protein 1-like [Teleopsis dalmanni]
MSNKDKIKVEPDRGIDKVPSLASTLHHHQTNPKSSSSADDENSTGPSASVGATSPHTDYMIKCPQCSIRLSGVEALRDHIIHDHPHDKLNYENYRTSHVNIDSDDNESSTSVNTTKNSNNNNNNNNTIKNNNSIQNNDNDRTSQNSPSLSSYSNMIPTTLATPPVHASTTASSLSPLPILSSAPDLSATTPYAAHHNHHTSAAAAAAAMQHHQLPSHLPANLHPVQFMAALAMQTAQNGACSNGGSASSSSTSSRTSPTSQLLALANGQHQHNVHHLSHNAGNSSSLYDLDGARSTSSPSSTLGDSSAGHYQCMQCTATFQTRDQLEKHELLHSPNAQAQSQGGANQVSSSFMKNEIKQFENY